MGPYIIFDSAAHFTCIIGKICDNTINFAVIITDSAAASFSRRATFCLIADKAADNCANRAVVGNCAAVFGGYSITDKVTDNTTNGHTDSDCHRAAVFACYIVDKITADSADGAVFGKNRTA